MSNVKLSETLEYLGTPAGKSAAARALGLATRGPVQLGQTSKTVSQQNAVPVLQPQNNAKQKLRQIIPGLAPAGRGGLSGQKTNPIERYGPLNGAIDGKPGANVRYG